MPQRILSPEEAKRAEFWNNKWPKDRIIYDAQYGRPRDVRTFIFDRSYILEDVLDNYGIVYDGNDDETMYKILMSVMRYFHYVGDDKSKGQPEFWQNPEDSATLGTGDCEDGAILIKSLSLVAGVPDYKVKIAAGMVKGGGHAYVLYLRDNDTQCILDWCYWPNDLQIMHRKDWRQEENYYDVWFSFNKEYSFAAVSTNYGRGGKVNDKAPEGK
jgi:predicted transglutaminase-like cysteine proteinase